MKLDGIGALVAGGASGLGAATARELTARGARVAVVDRDGDRAAALAEELEGAVAHQADVTEEAEVEAAVAAAVEALRRAPHGRLVRGHRLGRAHRRKAGAGRSSRPSRPSCG